MADAERSSIEIKILLKNLDPTKSSIKHKDRLRRLNKFRNYVTAKPPPEFYDDDYPLLLLGSESPMAMEDEELENMNLVGLLRAAGCPSTDHKDSLKRSARPTISLLRYLCLDFGRDAPSLGGKNASAGMLFGELNGFASALCALNVPQLRTLRFDIHVGRGSDGDMGFVASSRGGSKDDACHLLALILTRHTDTDHETPKPLKVQDFLPEANSQAEFKSWLEENASPDVRRAIKENIAAASSSGGKDHARGGGGGRAANATSAAGAVGKGGGGRDRNPFDDDDDVDKDFLEVFGKKSSPGPPSQAKTVKALGGELGGGMLGTFMPGDKPTRWSETQMASETERASGAIFIEEEVGTLHDIFQPMPTTLVLLVFFCTNFSFRTHHTQHCHRIERKGHGRAPEGRGRKETSPWT
jgi:hypothetical protein